MGILKQSFGKSTDNRAVFLYEITNGSQMSIAVTDFGAALVKIVVPDKNGNPVDVALGYDTAEGYYENGCHFGAVIGRNGNRIGNASFEINGKRYQLAVNDNKNNLHSGPDWYRTRVWDVTEVNEEENSVTFRLFSPDGDQGFPGNFTCFVTYRLTEENEVVLHYQGSADTDTVVNMTNHSYFNLAGHDQGAEAMLEHEVQIFAPEYTPVFDSEAIPTGEIAQVAGTPMDFYTCPKKIGQDVEADFEQLKFTGGYDHNYALCRRKGDIRRAAKVVSSRTGIAICDKSELLASPVCVVEEKHFPTTIQKVANQAEEQGAELVVVGHPLNMDGSKGPRAQLCEEFAEKLEELVSVPVVLWDERQTTVSAIGFLNETNTRGKKRKQGKADVRPVNEDAATPQELKRNHTLRTGGNPKGRRT